MAAPTPAMSDPYGAARERNVVVLQLRGMYAGALPISAQSLLEKISDTLRRNNVQVTWYRHEGRPTAALRFQADQPRPTMSLHQLDVRNGVLTIVGGAADPVPRAALPDPAGLSPQGN